MSRPRKLPVSSLMFSPKPAESVTVEYDSRGRRVSKTFSDAYEARSFYVRKKKEGKSPRIAAAS